jgi:hypothetical protein
VRRSAFFAIIAGLTGCLLLAGCEQQLPEQTSQPAQLYLKRCGRCHVAYNPRALTAAMWQQQMRMMDERIHQAGLPPLTPSERQTILEYLSRNSTHQ